MAPRSTPRRPSSWRLPLAHCLVLLAALGAPLRIPGSPSLAEAKIPTSTSASARSRRLPIRPLSKNSDASDERSPTSTRWSSGPSHIRMLQRRASSSHRSLTRDVDAEWSLATGLVVSKMRGGASSEESEEYDEESSEEYDSDSEEEYDSDSEGYDSESEEEEEEVAETSLKSSLVSKSKGAAGAVEYDDLLTPPAMQQFIVSIGVMMLANRIDIMDAKVVRIARFAFLAYIVSVQAFLLYVRLRAKATNDRTPITLSNPLASLVQNGGGGGNFMVKALADQVLSTQTTVLEYDLKQAKKMNGGLLFPMVFLYFLHFKMKQVQPLLMQTATGFSNLVYSPLFQVYVLGRNLERPFKPPGNPMMEAMMAQQTGGEGDGASAEEGNEVEEADDGEEGDATDEEEEEEGEDDAEEGSDDEEYDSDEE